MTRIFFNTVWQEYDYQTLYSTFGITDTQSKNITAYDRPTQESLLNPVIAWFNSGLNWVVQDQTWYPQDSTPYFVLQDLTLPLFYIQQEASFPIYLYLDSNFTLYNNHFVSQSYPVNEEGFSETLSTLYQDLNWCWYNPEYNQYWDNRQGRKYWSPTPPLINTPTMGVILQDGTEVEDNIPERTIGDYQVVYPNNLLESAIPSDSVSQYTISYPSSLTQQSIPFGTESKDPFVVVRTMKILVSDFNVRSEPNLSSTILGVFTQDQLAYGDLLSAVDNNGNLMLPLRLMDGQTGYMNSSYSQGCTQDGPDTVMAELPETTYNPR
jgi:hypothetical protein